MKDLQVMETLNEMGIDINDMDDIGLTFIKDYGWLIPGLTKLGIDFCIHEHEGKYYVEADELDEILDLQDANTVALINANFSTH